MPQNIDDILQQYDLGQVPSLADLFSQYSVDGSQVVGLEEDYQSYFQPYEQKQEQFARDDFLTQQESIGNQLADLVTQRGYAQKGYQQNIGQARQGAQQRLMDLLSQTQSSTGQAGFARSGALQRREEQSRGELIEQFGSQREGLQSQLEQQMNALQQQELGLQSKEEAIGTTLADTIYGYRKDYREGVHDRIIDLLNSGLSMDDIFQTMTENWQDYGGGGTGGGGGGAGEPDVNLPGTGGGGGDDVEPPVPGGPPTFNYGALAGVGVSNWSANDWVNWYANWYAENNDGITLSVLPDANSWSAGDWMDWYESQFGNPNPFG